MNKNVKKIIAIALAIGAFSGIGPLKYINILNTTAYASSSSADELSSLELETSSGDSISLYTDSSYDDELDDDLSNGTTYYAKTSANKIVISSIDGADEDNVRIFKSGSSKAYEVGDNISISKGTTTLKVRVYEDEYDEDEDYSSSDYNQYTIVVKDVEDDEDVDLAGISINSGIINFNYNTTSYNVNVPTATTTLTVQAIPKDDDYTVKIDGTTVDKDDKYKKTVTLDTDSDTDTIKVIVSNDDDSKTYTLNITKTDDYINNGMNQQGNGMQNQSLNVGMQNQQSNMGMQNNQWNNNGTSQGNQKIGWQQSEGAWYYYDQNGSMKTGWLKDSSGKWYYLNQYGKMLTDTQIDGYKIGNDGAWIN